MATAEAVLFPLLCIAHAGIVDTHFRRQEASAKLFPGSNPVWTLSIILRQLIWLILVQMWQPHVSGEQCVLLSVFAFIPPENRTYFLSSHKLCTVPLTEEATQLELHPSSGWTSAHSGSIHK